MGFKFFPLRKIYVPQTGLTTSYVNFDDAYYLKGYPNDSTRFLDNGDGTITDKATGLMWSKNLTIGGRKTWINAIAYCEASTLAGYTDWRMPNIKELFTIVDFNMVDTGSGINPFYSVFTQRESEEYWTSTTVRTSNTIAWELNGTSTSFHDKTDPTPFVCLVRGG